MADYIALGILAFDHIEFAVHDLEKASEWYLRMGFEKSAVREIKERGLRSYLFTQNQIAIVLSQSQQKSDVIFKFVEAHGDGLCQVGFRCKDATTAFEIAVQRGAEVAEGPKTSSRDFGQVNSASIKAFGDVRHTFVSREGTLFGEGFEIPFRAQNTGFGLQAIDHITSNVAHGQLEGWGEYYERIFGLKNTSSVPPKGEAVTRDSMAMESPDGVIKMLLNEPTEDDAQVQDFLDINHGPGVQHVALTSNQLIASLNSLKKSGVPFLGAPSPAYYQEVSERVPQLEESLADLENLSILIGGGAKGYLLQVYSGQLVGPFGYEFIQRKGDANFGKESANSPLDVH